LQRLEPLQQWLARTTRNSDQTLSPTSCVWLVELTTHEKFFIDTPLNFATDLFKISSETKRKNIAYAGYRPYLFLKVVAEILNKDVVRT